MYKFYRCILLMVLPFMVNAQTFTPDPDWRFENFNNLNHFINRNIYNLTVDDDGYLWTASTGVQRFDGLQLVEYNSLSNAAGALKDNYTDVISDDSGRVWVSSVGLCYFDKATDKFIYVQPDSTHKLKYAYNFAIQKNTLWFICNYGLAKLNLRTLKLELTSLKDIPGSVFCIYPLDDNTLFISNYTKWFTYNCSSDSYAVQDAYQKGVLTHIYAIERNKNDIYFSTDNGVYLTNNMAHINISGMPVLNVSSESMAFLPQDKLKRYLFVSSQGLGIVVYDTFLKRVAVDYKYNANAPFSLQNNVVNKLFVDKKSRLWVATSSGVSMLDLNNQQWKMRFIDKDIPYVQQVTKINRDKFDTTKVWMSSLNVGMIHLDWKTKKIEATDRGKGNFMLVKDFVQVNKNKILLVCPTALIEWDPIKGTQFIQRDIPYPDAISQTISCRRIIKKDSDKYFLTTNRGLFKYSLQTHAFTAVTKSDDKDPGVLNGFYNNGALWVAKQNGGLLRYDVATGESNLYRDSQLLESDFFDVIPVADNQLVCPSLNGFAIFNTQTKKFKHIHQVANIYNAKCISAIATNNIIWLGTEAGLLTYDLKTHRSTKAECDRNIMEIFPLSPFTRVGEDVAMGFRKGYAYFSPDFKNSPVPTAPVIESFKINNQPILSEPQKRGKNILSFSYKENAVNIAFTAFLFSDPDNINFRYRLKGADTGWQYPGNQRSANYAQLQPGSYTFLVQSGNSNSYWNNNVTSISFTITPPYWGTWWFRTLFLLAVASILYQLYQYKMRHLKTIEIIRQNIASDFHDDLGSTLSSISIFSEVASQKTDTDLPGAKNMIDDIGVRARAMIHSMNDMVWTIRPENDNLYKLMQRMEEFSYPVAEAKEIQLSFLMDEGLYNIKTDMVRRKNLFLIFKEAFNNAVKYSNADSIQVRFKLDHNKVLVMRVTDDGCGFKYDSRRPGNGLGNMHKRAAEIKGKLAVNTTPGKGTEINIICKIA